MPWHSHLWVLGTRRADPQAGLPAGVGGRQPRTGTGRAARSSTMVDLTLLAAAGSAIGAIIALCLVLDFARLLLCRLPVEKSGKTKANACSRAEQWGIFTWSRVDHFLHFLEVRWALHGMWMCCRRPRKIVYKVLPVDAPTDEPLTTGELAAAYRALEAVSYTHLTLPTICSV